MFWLVPPRFFEFGIKTLFLVWWNEIASTALHNVFGRVEWGWGSARLRPDYPILDCKVLNKKILLGYSVESVPADPDSMGSPIAKCLRWFWIPHITEPPG